MKFGDAVQLQVHSENLEESLEFYDKLGYRTIVKNDLPYKWALLTDGFIRLTVGESKFYGITYYAADMDERLEELKKSGFKIKDASLELAEHHYNEIVSPSGVRIALVKYDAEKLLIPEGETPAVCGVFHEVSVLTKDIEKSKTFLEKAGFKITHKPDDGMKWVSLHDGLMGIGLYTKEVINHYFEGPAITYFSRDMAERIKELRKRGVEFKEEIKDKDGNISDAIALSPEGQTFFFFKA